MAVGFVAQSPIGGISETCVASVDSGHLNDLNTRTPWARQTRRAAMRNGSGSKRCDAIAAEGQRGLNGTGLRMGPFTPAARVQCFCRRVGARACLTCRGQSMQSKAGQNSTGRTLALGRGA